MMMMIFHVNTKGVMNVNILLKPLGSSVLGTSSIQEAAHRGPKPGPREDPEQGSGEQDHQPPAEARPGLGKG
jgi:hypothetical protein